MSDAYELSKPIDAPEISASRLFPTPRDAPPSSLIRMA
jgi:hypothetical protein